MPSYRVRTIVTATVEEVWIIDAPQELTPEEIEGRLLGDYTINADLRHVSDETKGDERDREILKVEVI